VSEDFSIWVVGLRRFVTLVEQRRIEIVLLTYLLATGRTPGEKVRNDIGGEAGCSRDAIQQCQWLTAQTCVSFWNLPCNDTGWYKSLVACGSGKLPVVCQVLWR